MNIINTLNLWDTNLFLFINGIHASFFDGIMFAISAKLTWVPLYIAALYVVIKKWKRESVWVILALVLCIVIADQVSSGFIKHAVQRLRPSHAEDLKGMVHLVKGYGGGMFGFVSSHAANSFGFALLSSILFKNRKYTFVIFGWAALLSYSRVYLGVHYPGDIFGGMIVGVLAAMICFFAIKKLRPSILKLQNNISQAEPTNTFIPILVLGLSFLGIIIYSLFVF
ncbi:MAG: phosphatase PAP2 family protein [Paludibacter sp.]|nr:phosphatase PAP2 family protein [Paludibacter sp.]